MTPARLSIDQGREVQWRRLDTALPILQDDCRVALANRHGVHEGSDCWLVHGVGPYIMDPPTSSEVHRFGNAEVHGSLYNAGMDKERPPHYLRQWRLHRKMTQEQLADAVGTSKTQISELERFNLQLSPKWLRKLAPVLEVQQGHILDHNPDDLDSDILDIWTRIPERDRRTAARVLQGFVKTGTDD